MKTTLIKAGGRRKSKISQENQIILTLVYLRHQVNFQLLRITFEVSESTAHKIFHNWQKIIREALPSSLLEQVKKYEILSEILAKLTEYELYIS
jgi:hypothetical protein